MLMMVLGQASSRGGVGGSSLLEKLLQFAKVFWLCPCVGGFRGSRAGN